MAESNLREGIKQMDIPDVLKKHWDGNLPVDLNSLAQKIGLTIVWTSNESPPASYERKDKKLFVSKKLTAKAQRFYLAHLIAHHELGHEPPIETPHHVTSACKDKLEVSANRLASRILMPAPLLKHAVYQDGISSLDKLATIFNVSTAAIEYRLKMLKMI